MIDLNDIHSRIRIVDQEDRALLRSNPSAWSMPEDGQEHMIKHMLLPSCSSFGLKAINLLSWCSAPTKVKHITCSPPVGHMSGLYILLTQLRIKTNRDRTIILTAEKNLPNNDELRISMSHALHF